MDVFKTPGAFSWCELMTTEPTKAVEFYGSLFGWTTKAMDMGGMGTYHVASLGEAQIAGIGNLPPDGPPMPPNWGVYVTVADCDATVAKAQSLGATLCAGPFDVPTVGRMAVLQDPQGAVFNVMAYSM